MVKLILILALLPGLASAQAIRKKRAILTPVYDSIPQQYSIYSIKYIDSATERLMVLGFRNGNWISFPQDSVMFAKYPGTNRGATTDSLLTIRNGVVNQMSKGKLTLSASQITGRTTAAATRAFNSSFRPSTTRDVFVGYTATIDASFSVSGGQSGTVFLEISANNSTWVEMARMTNGNNGAIAIGLGLVNTQTGQLAAIVPAGYYVRLRTTGNATITYISGTETSI